MKAEEQVVFLAELLNLIGELQDLVRGYINVLTSDKDGCMLERDPADNNVHF